MLGIRSSLRVNPTLTLPLSSKDLSTELPVWAHACPPRTSHIAPRFLLRLAFGFDSAVLMLWKHVRGHA